MPHTFMNTEKAEPAAGKVKVVHLITELSIGGAQMVLLRLLEGTNIHRYSPKVICYYNGEGTIARQIRSLGVPVADLEMHSKWRVDALGRLVRLLQQQRPAILHTWMFHANIPGRVLGKLAGIPIVVSCEQTMGQERDSRLWLNWLTSPMANRIICVSNQGAKFASEQIGLPEEKLVVIPNGINTRSFEVLPSSESVRARLDLPVEASIVGAVGRPRPVKGYDFLLEAFAQLSAARPNDRLLIVGDGPDQSMLKRRARDLGLGSRVTFLGDQPDVRKVLPALDLIALPSLHEGMPVVALEAMAAGLPVVATAVGGTPEVVVDGETGLLVPPRDPQALALAIKTLLDDPERAREMGQRGRERVARHFDIRETVRLTEALYEELLREKGLLPTVR